MNAENKNGRPNTNRHSTVPRPYKQGNLDSLCGIYAIINACRHACASLETKKQLGSWELFTVLVDALEERGKLTTVLCYGISAKDHNHLLTIAAKFMLGKHGLFLNIKRPLKHIKAPSLAKVSSLLSYHLEQSGTSALLEFEAPSFEHWTVISHIIQDHIHFIDSTGMRPRPLKELQIKSARPVKPTTNVAFVKSGLVLLKLERVP